MSRNNKDLQKKLADIKQTRPRKLVITVLQEAKTPMSAVQIQSEIEKKGENVWLSTVYRFLDLLVERDIVIKSTVLDQEQSVFGLNRYEHTHYAVCVSCHMIIPMDNCPMARSDFNPGLKDKNFKVIGHKIELYGYCNQCQEE